MAEKMSVTRSRHSALLSLAPFPPRISPTGSFLNVLLPTETSLERPLLLAPSGTLGTSPRCSSDGTHNTPHIGCAELIQPFQDPHLLGHPRRSNIYFLIRFRCISYLLAYVTVQMEEIDNNKQLQRTFPSLPGPPEHGAHRLLSHTLPYQLCQPHACDTPHEDSG